MVVIRLSGTPAGRVHDIVLSVATTWVILGCGTPVVMAFVSKSTGAELYDVMTWMGAAFIIVLFALGVLWREQILEWRDTREIFGYGGVMGGLLAGFYASWVGLALGLLCGVYSVFLPRLMRDAPEGAGPGGGRPGVDL